MASRVRGVRRPEISGNPAPVGHPGQRRGDEEKAHAPGEGDPDCAPDRLLLEQCPDRVDDRRDRLVSPKARTGPGIVAVGTKAELTKGRKRSGYEKPTAPSVDFANNPAITATQVSASVSRRRMPATASYASTPAEERKPITSPTRTMTATEMALDTSEVRTCPHSTEERAIGIEWNLSKMPLCRSLNSRKAV